mgnify:FL=1
MQFTTANYDRGAPRYWTVEWSEDGNENGTWEYISEYSVPDLPNWSNTLFTQLPGLKNINVKLPLEMLGKTDLYIRMRPTDNEAGDDYDYDGKPIAAGKNNAIGYLSIRYNK